MNTAPKYKNKFHPGMDTQQCLESLEHFAQNNVCVLPCWGKMPLGSTTTLAATGALACYEYTKAILLGEKEYAQEISGVCGVTHGGYICVLDVEDQCMWDLEMGVPLDITACSTKSGKTHGYHLWFYSRPGLPNNYDFKKDGVLYAQFFNNHHAIILPGSWYPGKEDTRYAFKTKRDIRPIQDALCSVLAKIAGPRRRSEKDNLTELLFAKLGIPMRKTEKGTVDVVCPWEDEHTKKDYKIGSDTSIMPNGAFVCQHSHQDTINTTEKLVARLDQDGRWTNVRDVWRQIKKEHQPKGLLLNRSGIAPNDANARILVKHEFGGRLQRSARWWQDTFYLDGERVSAENVTEHIVAPIQAYCTSLSRKMVIQEVQSAAEGNEVDEIRVWLESNTAVPVHPSRIVEDVFDVPASDPKSALYVEALRVWLRTAVGRAMVGGTPARYMLVLAGRQHIGKSFFFEALTRPMVPEGQINRWYNPEFHMEEDEDRMKKSILKIEGAFIAEIRELEKVVGYADKSDFKGFMDLTHYSYVRPHILDRIERPRRWVWAGTSNESTIFGDASGQSRYLVIPLPQPDYTPIGKGDMSWWQKLVPGLWAWALQDWRKLQHTEACYVIPKDMMDKLTALAEMMSSAADQEDELRAVLADLRHVIKDGQVLGSEVSRASRGGNRRLKRTFEKLGGKVMHTRGGNVWFIPDNLLISNE